MKKILLLLLIFQLSHSLSAQWNTPVVVDDGGGTDNVGQHTSLMIVNGNPAICYRDVTNGDLNYVRPTNSTGLPVKLIRFTGKGKPEGSVLEWQTASEIGNAGFDIEWSAPKGQADRRIWESVAFVKGVGDSFTTVYYKYSHDEPAPGINYYRLKQKDYDGSFVYSDIVSVQYSVGSPQLMLFPNPVQNSSFTLYLLEIEAETVEMTMYDYTGRLVSQIQLTHNQTEINV